VAVGADELIIEIHPDPNISLKDGMQFLQFEQYAQFVPRILAVAQAVGRI